MSYHELVEEIDKLDLNTLEELRDLISKRLIEEWRAEIKTAVEQARANYASGNVKRGTVATC